MEQDPSSGRKEQQTSQQAEDVPTPSNQPNATKAKTAEAINTKQEKLEKRIQRGEIWMISLTAVIALFTLGSVFVAYLQWRVMSAVFV